MATPDPNVERYVAQMRDLPPPALTRPAVEEWLKQIGVPAAEIAMLATAILTGDDVGA